MQLLLVTYGLALILILGRYLHCGFTAGKAVLFRKETLLQLTQPYFTLDFLQRTYRRILAILGIIYLFLHFKHLILWWHKANFDLTYWNLDRLIHFGVQPNIWAMELLGQQHDAAVLIDWLYIAYFKYKLVVSLFFLLEIRGKKLSDQFFFAYALLWGLGGLAYVVAPADGPCFAVLSAHSIPKDNHFHMFQYPIVKDVPDSYVEKFVEAKIYYAKYYHEKLWIDRQEFLAGHGMPGVFYGIAAMPSLHVGAMMMLMIFLWRASSVAGFFGAIYFGIVFIGSIFLQWHYALDGYVGMFLAAFVCWLAQALPERWPRRKAEP